MTTILIVRNRIDGRWDYGPTLLRRVLQYGSDGGTYPTASAAKAAAYRDPTIPRPVTLTIVKD